MKEHLLTITIATAIFLPCAMAQQGQVPIPPPPPPITQPPATDPNAGTDVQPEGAAQAPSGPSVITSQQQISDVVIDPVTGEEVPQDSGAAAKKWWLEDITLNDLFVYLANHSEEGFQFLKNPALNEIRVSGFIPDGKPTLEQIKQIAFQYGLVIFVKDGNGLVALTEEQVKALPKREWTYTLKYLRFGSTQEDQEGIAEMLKPVMSETGSVRFEPKSGMLVVIDNDFAIESIQKVMDQIDIPKKQVIIDVKILRLLNTSANRMGVDWAQSLGDGVQIGATVQGPLNQIFDTTPVFGTATSLANQAADAISGAVGGNDGGTDTGTDTGGTGGTTGETVAPTVNGVILSPIQLTAVLRALMTKEGVVQESGPAVVAEDNEDATFEIVDLIPIVTQTVSQANGVNNISTEVTYDLPDSGTGAGSEGQGGDQSTRIGVRVTVRPSILPDGTIRMKLSPSTASITGYTRAYTGFGNIFNEYPRVRKSAVDTVARLPNGYSLVLGGYYETSEGWVDNKVPFLGDIPLLNFAFKSKQRTKIRSNTVFILTPIAYDAASEVQTAQYAEKMRSDMVPPKHTDYPDDDMPGEDTNPNFLQRIRNLWPIKPKPVDTNPVSPDNPVNAQRIRIKTEQEKRQEKIRAEMRDQAIESGNQ